MTVLCNVLTNLKTRVVLLKQMFTLGWNQLNEELAGLLKLCLLAGIEEKTHILL